MAKSISVGNAARNGLLSALLARDGFSGPARPLEGERGFLRIATDAPKLEAVCDGLGERWELLTNTYKPYPCGVVLNPVIEACLALAADERLAVAEIDRHRDHRSSAAARAHRPARRAQRARSAGQRAARGRRRLARAKAGLPEFSDAAVADPALRALGSKVAFKDDDSYAVDAARVSIRLRTGATLEKFVEHAYGGPARPMADADLETKLRQLAEYGGVRRELAPLIDALWSLERAADVAAVMALARSDAASRP